MSYKTYAEAKIANPDCEIVTTIKNWSGAGKFIGAFEVITKGHYIGDMSWVICNPADYCSTLKEFLDAGLELVEDDKFIGVNGSVIEVKAVVETNKPNESDSDRYILSAAALNGGCKITAKAEKWTIYNNTLPLGELSDEQAAQLFNSWRKVGVDKNTKWNLEEVYRIKPESDRDLFIAASLQLMSSETERTMEHMFGAQFDAGARYTDITQFFGESI